MWLIEQFLPVQFRVSRVDNPERMEVFAANAADSVSRSGPAAVQASIAVDEGTVTILDPAQLRRVQ
jgi:hypothetical protein